MVGQRVLHLFPDTNLFIQCRPLQDLDWSIWSEFDELRLIVTRPVQREIDAQKNKARGRVNDRARKASSLFREVLRKESGTMTVQDADPRVLLEIRPELRTRQQLDGELDYAERDDQLVGTVAEFIEAQVDHNAMLLTHDTGPMATSTMVGVPYFEIPDDWLLPPESTGQDKTIVELRRQIAELKQQEPEFEIVCLDTSDNVIDHLELDVIRYTALTDDEVNGLLEQIRQHHPMISDFDPPARSKSFHTLDALGQVNKTYEPPDQEEIEIYTESLYPEWIEACEEILRGIHRAIIVIEGNPTFTFQARNTGSRPAADALISFWASGNFSISPPERPDPEESAKRRERTTLPTPPTPPQGRWVSTIDKMLTNYQSLFGSSPKGFPVDHDFLAPHLGIPRPRDPNAFYYKSGSTSFPGESFSLECAQWRHGVQPENFEGEIVFGDEAKRVEGVVDCEIHAQNLTRPAIKRLPIRLTVQHVSVLGRATQIVEELNVRPQLKLKGT